MKKISKLLSVILCLAMVMSFAFVVSAEETDNAITSMDQLVSGDYIIIAAHGFGLAHLDGTWVLAEEGDSVNGSVWTLTVTDNGVKIADCNGAYIAPKGGNANGITEGEYEWAVSCEDGMFIFAGQGEDTVKLASNVGSDNKFRAYKNATIESQGAEKYPYTFALYPVESAPQPAGPVDCEIPGTLSYTFETDDAASAGVMFQWTATADGELCVARIGEGYMTTVQINGTYGEIGNEGYVVKTGDVVTIIVYAYGAGTVNVPVTYISGNQGEAALGTAENPEVITSLAGGIEKTLESGEYYFQYTAAKAGELTISTVGDGTHNMEVFVNGDATKVYSNWDNDGAFVALTVAEGDVLSIKVYFDYPGAGTISFYSDFDMDNNDNPTQPSVPTISDGKYVISWNGLTFAALAEDKNYGYAPAGDVNALTDADYITIVNMGDGMFTMQDCYGRYIYMAGNYNSFNVSAELPESGYLWVLEETEGGYLLKNVEKEKYMAYSADYSTWGCYPTDKSEPGVLGVTAYVDNDPNQPTGDAIFAVLAVLAVSGMGLTVVASKKK